MPEKYVLYDKMFDYCYTGNPLVNMHVAVPVHDSVFHNRLYRSRFTDYCIAHSEVLNLSLVFLYGNNPAQEPVHLVFMCKSDFIHKVFQENVSLGTRAFLIAGVNYRPDLSLQEKTKCLFEDVKRSVSIGSNVPDGRMYRFNYLDSSGNIFHQSYQSTVLELVQVDEVSHDVKFIMRMQ